MVAAGGDKYVHSAMRCAYPAILSEQNCDRRVAAHNCRGQLCTKEIVKGNFPAWF
jgi:hypothetical protein